MTILYDVQLSRPGKKLARIATVKAVTSEAFYAYHLIDGDHLEPDYAAIGEALPHFLRKAFSKRGLGRTWFPVTRIADVTETPDDRNYCYVELWSADGERQLGKVYAVPYRSK